MKVIGVTGGIGSGKSTVTRILSDLGAEIIDADKIAREITAKGEPALQELVDYFGPGILNDNGELRRTKLAEIVFVDKEKLDILNSITHKYVVKRLISHLEKLRYENKTSFTVLDVPIPVKHGFLDIVNEVWVVTADKETRIKRVMERNKISYEEAVNRIQSQKSDEEYLRLANEVIINNGTLEELEGTIARLYVQKKLGQV
ncbi:MAG TPA: dephospho-CoA kinase [Clostridiales bacterium]|nr:dephospho-CoA kinase [Clostridiales bacterium]